MAWSPSGKVVYVSGDGDNMGSSVAKAILSNDEKKAKAISKNIIRGEVSFVDLAKKLLDSTTIIAGGDDILLRVSADKFDPDAIERLRKHYHTTTGGTITVGVGNDMVQAHQCLVVGKETGKNKAVFWTEEVADKFKSVVGNLLANLKTKSRERGVDVESERELVWKLVESMNSRKPEPIEEAKAPARDAYVAFRTMHGVRSGIVRHDRQGNVHHLTRKTLHKQAAKAKKQMRSRSHDESTIRVIVVPGLFSESRDPAARQRLAKKLIGYRNSLYRGAGPSNYSYQGNAATSRGDHATAIAKRLLRGPNDVEKHDSRAMARGKRFHLAQLHRYGTPDKAARLAGIIKNAKRKMRPATTLRSSRPA